MKCTWQPQLLLLAFKDLAIKAENLLLMDNASQEHFKLTIYALAFSALHHLKFSLGFHLDQALLSSESLVTKIHKKQVLPLSPSSTANADKACNLEYRTNMIFCFETCMAKLVFQVSIRS